MLSNIFCINLNSRKKRKKWISKHLKKNKIHFKFYQTKLHKNPVRGCLESHLNIIKLSLSLNLSNVTIFEDDAKIIRSIANLPDIPNDWNMLYYGGTVKNVIQVINKDLARVLTWTTHAYTINLTDKKFVNDLLKMETYDKDIDRFYVENIHPKYNAYMLTPMRIIQRDGYSDIENRKIQYDFMENSIKGFKKPDYEKKDNNYILKLDKIDNKDLPKITIITPTFNRRNLFYIALNNINNTTYPKNKIEWIIVEEESDNMVEDIVPKWAKYIKLKNKTTIAHKRNIACLNSTSSIILHMDDDDYYPPNSFLARTKILLKYPDYECIGCSNIGVYDIINDKSSIASDGLLSLSEASMAYTKRFWIEHNFNPKTEKGEFKDFIMGRFDKIMDIPYSFVLIAINHNSNFTNRKITSKLKNDVNFIDTWDIDEQLFFYELRDSLI